MPSAVPLPQPFGRGVFKLARCRIADAEMPVIVGQRQRTGLTGAAIVCLGGLPVGIDAVENEMLPG
jgi:hypothetical protein